MNTPMFLKTVMWFLLKLNVTRDGFSIVIRNRARNSEPF